VTLSYPPGEKVGTRPLDEQQPPKFTLNIWYRGAIELGIKNVVPGKSGDTIRFFKRELSSNPRVYSIQYNRADYVPIRIEITSYAKRKVVHSSRPPFTFKTGKVDFSDDFVEMKEDFVEVIITFKPGVGKNENFAFNLNLVSNRP
jgi:hypothetical protein